MSRDIGYTCQAILPRYPKVNLAHFSVAEHYVEESIVVSWPDGDVLSHKSFADKKLLVGEADVAVATYFPHLVINVVLDGWQYLRIRPTTGSVTGNRRLLVQRRMWSDQVVLFTPLVKGILARR